MIPHFLIEVIKQATVNGVNALYQQVSSPSPETRRASPARRSGGFEQHIRRLASEIDLHIADLDVNEQVAMLELTGAAEGYSVCVVCMPNGNTFLQLLSLCYWDGPPPQAAQHVAKRLDESSSQVSFKAKRLDSGKSRIVASTVTNPLASLPTDHFLSLTGEMALKMAVGDKTLSTHGHF